MSDEESLVDAERKRCFFVFLCFLFLLLLFAPRPPRRPRGAPAGARTAPGPPTPQQRRPWFEVTWRAKKGVLSFALFFSCLSRRHAVRNGKKTLKAGWAYSFFFFASSSRRDRRRRRQPLLFFFLKNLSPSRKNHAALLLAAPADGDRGERVLAPALFWSRERERKKSRRKRRNVLERRRQTKTISIIHRFFSSFCLSRQRPLLACFLCAA